MSSIRDNSVGLAKRGFGIARRTCCRRVEQVEVASADTDTMITEHTWACYEGHPPTTVSALEYVFMMIWQYKLPINATRIDEVP